jgi:hypothetical protein
MSDEEWKREPADRSFINPHAPNNLEFWTKEFGVNEARLLRLIGEHGVMVAAIRQAIDDSRDCP